MSHAREHPVRCEDPSCGARHQGGKWGTIRAGERGWFHARDGRAYCPKHVPKWVKKWRTE